MILSLGVLATLLGLIQAHVGNTVLHWVVVAVPVVAAVLVAVAGRRAVGQRWVMLRAAAEAIKAEIYRYRGSALLEPVGKNLVAGAPAWIGRRTICGPLGK